MSLYLVGPLAERCRCTASLYDVHLTFDPTVVTLNYKILSILYLGNYKVLEVDTWQGH